MSAEPSAATMPAEKAALSSGWGERRGEEVGMVGGEVGRGEDGAVSGGWGEGAR
jgi:hypothetical protein